VEKNSKVTTNNQYGDKQLKVKYPEYWHKDQLEMGMTISGMMLILDSWYEF
jgi:hypothetical protein